MVISLRIFYFEVHSCLCCDSIDIGLWLTCFFLLNLLNFLSCILKHLVEFIYLFNVFICNCNLETYLIIILMNLSDFYAIRIKDIHRTPRVWIKICLFMFWLKVYILCQTTQIYTCYFSKLENALQMRISHFEHKDRIVLYGDK